MHVPVGLLCVRVPVVLLCVHVPVGLTLLVGLEGVQRAEVLVGPDVLHGAEVVQGLGALVADCLGAAGGMGMDAVGGGRRSSVSSSRHASPCHPSPPPAVTTWLHSIVCVQGCGPKV